MHVKRSRPGLLTHTADDTELCKMSLLKPLVDAFKPSRFRMSKPLTP